MDIEEVDETCEKLHKLFSMANEAGEKLVAIKNIPVEYLKFTIEALEKQNPKKVNEIYKAKHIEDIEAYGENALFGYCPMCDELQCSVWNANTCGDCGQALNWEVEE